MDNAIYQAHVAKALASDAVIRVKNLLASRDPKVVAAVKKANAALLNCKLLTPGAVHVDSTLSKLSIQYQNEEFIGTQLMPVVQVGKPSDYYFKYSKRDRLATPDDEVTTRSTPNEVGENRSKTAYTTKGYALLDFLDEKTREAQDEPLNEMVDLVAAVNDGLALREEKRIAAIMTDAANFPGQTAALAGADRWDTTTATPMKDIRDSIRACWRGAGSTKLIGYTSGDVFEFLRQHETILEQFKYTAVDLPTRQQLAGFFGLDDLLVGEAWNDTANEGQAASYSRVWGKVFGVARVARTTNIRTAAFGWTFRFGQKATSVWFDPKPGVAGGYYAKVGLQEGHHVAASDTAFLYTTVIS